MCLCWTHFVIFTNKKWNRKRSEIDALLENPAYITILNNSRWSIIDSVNILRGARKSNLKSFWHGLNDSWLYRPHRKVARPLLVNEDFEITSTIFKRLIKSCGKQRLWDVLLHWTITQRNYHQQWHALIKSFYLFCMRLMKNSTVPSRQCLNLAICFHCDFTAFIRIPIYHFAVIIYWSCSCLY